MNTIIILAIAALIGWITNFIAIRMLFRPRKPINLIIFTLHGLIPQRQSEIAKSIAEAVANDLITKSDVSNILTSDSIKARISDKLSSTIDTLLAKFTAANPMVAMFLQGEMGANIKTTLSNQLEAQLPALFEELVVAVEQDLDFKTIVEKRVASLDLIRLEELILRVVSKELKTIEILGGVLGFLVGLIQVAFT